MLGGRNVAWKPQEGSGSSFLYIRPRPDVRKFAEDGAEIMIETQWLNKQPSAEKCKALTGL